MNEATDGALLREISEPPSRPPGAQVNGVALSPLAHEWFDRESGRSLTKHPSGAANPASLTPSVIAPANDGNRSLDLVVGSPVQPTRIELKAFTRFDDSGPSGEVHSVLCEMPQQCGRVDGRRLALRVTVADDVRLVVVMLFYAVPLDPGDAKRPRPAFNFVSYGCRPVERQ